MHQTETMVPAMEIFLAAASSKDASPGRMAGRKRAGPVGLALDRQFRSVSAF